MPLFTYHFLYEAKGTFTYICPQCCDSYHERNFLSKWEPNTSLSDNYRTRDVQKASVLPLTDKNKHVPKLLDMTIKPPPFSILHKWWHYLRVPLRCCGDNRKSQNQCPKSSDLTCRKSKVGSKTKQQTHSKDLNLTDRVLSPIVTAVEESNIQKVVSLVDSNIPNPYWSVLLKRSKRRNMYQTATADNSKPLNLSLDTDTNRFNHVGKSALQPDVSHSASKPSGCNL